MKTTTMNSNTFVNRLASTMLNSGMSAKTKINWINYVGSHTQVDYADLVSKIRKGAARVTVHPSKVYETQAWLTRCLKRAKAEGKPTRFIGGVGHEGTLVYRPRPITLRVVYSYTQPDCSEYMQAIADSTPQHAVVEIAAPLTFEQEIEQAWEVAA